jgi:DNA-binding CsgD family transcriptional regulator
MNYVVTYNKYKDSIKDIDKVKRITALELNYKHQKEKLADSVRFANEKLSMELRVAAEQSKNKFYITLLLLAITSIISLFLWFNYRKKAAQNLLNKQQLEQELLDERIKNTKFQSQKVMADKAMRLQFTQEFLNKIKHILQHSKGHQNPELQTLISELQSQVKIEKRLEVLEENHANESVDFEKQLIEHFPELTKAEREICALMRLNLSLKDIMSIRNVTIGSIKSSRYRIRKKIDVPKGEELESFIQKLFSK